MIIQNFTTWKILVVSFVQNRLSLSWTEIPPRTQATAPKITVRDGEPYEVYGTLQLHEPGFVIPTATPTVEYRIFDGTYARFIKESLYPRLYQEGVLVCTEKHRTRIGI